MSTLLRAFLPVSRILSVIAAEEKGVAHDCSTGAARSSYVGERARTVQGDNPLLCSLDDAVKEIPRKTPVVAGSASASRTSIHAGI
jgi:hypothetical protein